MSGAERAGRLRLVGTWHLVSYDMVAPDGTMTKPYGEAVGVLSYDATGHMSGQVMRPGRTPVEAGAGIAQSWREAYTGYIAYFGTYEVNEAGDLVEHHVTGSLNPAWVGGRQVRQLQFDGELLLLQAVVQKGDNAMRHVLRWRKVG